MNCLEEWSASGVDTELIRLNVVPLDGIAASEYLLYSDAIPRRNDGRISETFLQLYSHTVEGGWWCSGIDLLTGEEDVWGCFKPDAPRQSGNRSKPIKYEHPPKTPTGVFALKVTSGVWEKIANRYRVKIAEQDLNPKLPDLGFWQWVINHPEIPLCVTEGAKKAGALLSAGYVAIALPGINNGYRTPKDDRGKRIGKSFLIPQLEVFTRSEGDQETRRQGDKGDKETRRQGRQGDEETRETRRQGRQGRQGDEETRETRRQGRQGREIYVVFDCDSKPNTIKAVNTAIKKTGRLFQQRDCEVKVVTWDSQLGKGVDDLIINQGQESFNRVYENALSLEIWQAKTWNQLTYSPEVVVNSPYLLNIDVPPENKLIGIKSAKGTGKTKLLENFVRQALEKSQKILVIGHRVQLVKALCQRFGLPYVTQLREQQKINNLGFGLCIDSLHPHSQAEFDPDDWSDSVVIIDEVEQVLWHGLNSATCTAHRVAILKSLKSLIQNVILGSGQVYIADADLSNIAVDYLISLTGIDLQPFIIENKWKRDSESSWLVYNYDGKSPKKLVNDLETHIKQGGKPLVCLSAQKLTSKWGTQTLEAYLSKKFPEKKILRIDSESLVDPHHPAYDCMSNLDRILANFDLVLASPSIETGISIELENHFTSVWAIAQGVQGENTVRQTLSRLRTNVPRYLWCASYSFCKIGNGSTSIPNLITSGHRLTQLNIRLLQQSDFQALDDIDTGFQAESLLSWAKMAVRYNSSTIKYRESILSALQEEGHQIIDASKINFPIDQPKTSKEQRLENNCLLEAITEIRQQNYQAECQAIADANLLTKDKYQKLKKRLVKNISQRRSIRKYELQQRYYLPVTEQLVALDDDGWYEKIQLNYFLTIGRSFLADRDTQVAQKLIQNGNGSLFIPDFNSSQLGAVVGTMEILGIPSLLADKKRELRNSDSDLQELAAIALSNRKEIKTVMGIGLAKNSSPILILRRFLEKIDYSLKYLRCESQDKGRKRIRIYQIMQPKDPRRQVFYHWLKRDQNIPGSSLFWEQDKFKTQSNSSPANQNKFLQLSLDL